MEKFYLYTEESDIAETFGRVEEFTTLKEAEARLQRVKNNESTHVHYKFAIIKGTLVQCDSDLDLSF